MITIALKLDLKKFVLPLTDYFFIVIILIVVLAIAHLHSSFEIK